MLERTRAGGLRGLALILVGIFMGATLITPAVAHVGGTISHLWGAPNHIKAKVKAFGDNRWLGKSATAANSELLDGVDSTGFVQNGAAAGGDLSGTYPNPTIANGAVGSAEVQDGDLKAGDAFALAGQLSVAEDPPNVPANSCVTDFVSVTGRQSGDMGLLFPSLNLTNPGFGGGPVVLMTHGAVGIDTVDKVHYTLCNVSNSDVNPPAGFWQYLVARP